MGRRWASRQKPSSQLLSLLSLIFCAQLYIIFHSPSSSSCAGKEQHAIPTPASLAASPSSSPSAPLEDPPLPRLSKPLIVACLANMRTVSTTAYNLARVLMERVDPNSVSGWEKDFTGSKKRILIRDVVPKAKGQVSMVYKSHWADQEYHNSADFFLVTHRDPYDMVCSMGNMFRPVFFTDFKRAISSCRGMADNEKGILRVAGKSGSALHVHHSALYSAESMAQVVEAMALKWNVTGGKIDARGVAREVLELRAPPEGVFPIAHPRTELHADHITASSSTKKDCTELRRALEADSVCRAWHDRYEQSFPPGTAQLVRDTIP